MLHMLYIGSNNDTHELESEKIKHICDQFFDGYTYQQGQGRWKCNPEPCAIVTIITDDGIGPRSHDLQAISDLIKVLKLTLKQDSILHVSIPCTVEFA